MITPREVLLQRMLPFNKCDIGFMQQKRHRNLSQENSIAADLEYHMMPNIFTVELFRKRAQKTKITLVIPSIDFKKTSSKLPLQHSKMF